MSLDLQPSAPRCGCGLYGCAESFIGGNALMHQIKFGPMAVPENISPFAFLDQEFLAGADWAITFYGKFARMLGAYLANLQLHDNVRHIIFRGTTVVKAFQLPNIQAWTRLAMKDRLPDPKMAEVDFNFLPIRKNLPKDWDAYFGAAAFAKDKLG
jgi:predicted NBD/HSP70 family sugar kinase